MHSVLRWTCFAASFVPLVDAKACTSTQLTQLSGVAETYFSSPDCAGSALDSSTKTVAVICAGSCMELVRELQPDAPDCEYDDTNLGESMSELVAWCDSAFSGSGSTSVSTSGSDSTSTSGSTDSSPTMNFVPICSIASITLIDDINTEAKTNADCLGSGGAATSATNKTAYCEEDSCVAYLTDMEDRLPNCTYGGYNIKQVVADTLALCVDPSLTWAPSTTPPVTQTTIVTMAPRATTQTPTAGSSASSQTTNAPAASRSMASATKPGASTAVAVVLLAIVLACRSSAN